ncbi:MAG: imidazoleglycerol-phosphate dehydratase HisB [Armatimonadetes bacterium]|nr:imidazoleglycerol-phosphate dehydratase HisB [Armatimonadota bacterium]
MRTAEITRRTSETQITVKIDLDGSGEYDINTGVGFFDHMLSHVAKHGLIDIILKAEGDLHIDAHHTVEDVGIVLGQALAQAVGDKRGLVRYGRGSCPMDEALVHAYIDFGGRAYLVYELDLPTAKVGDFDTELVREFFVALTANAGMSLHLIQQSGRNGHHILEGAFKSFARALDEAKGLDPRKTDVPSTKGML